MAPSSKAPAEEVEIAGHVVRLSSPDKICFPRRGYTKRDVFEYYLSVGDGIMRALGERPTTLQRFPDGIEGEMFFQKRIPTRGGKPAQVRYSSPPAAENPRKFVI
jgi:DNA primase